MANIITMDKEQINNPQHYSHGKDNLYEAIKVIEAWNLDFHLGNVVKYISRHDKKESVIQDLKKAQWYLARKIAKLEEGNKSILKTDIGL